MAYLNLKFPRLWTKVRAIPGIALSYPHHMAVTERTTDAYEAARERVGELPARRMELARFQVD